VHILPKHPHIIKQVKTTTAQDTQQMSHNTVFIVAPCILKSKQFTHHQMRYLLTLLKVLNLHLNTQ